MSGLDNRPNIIPIPTLHPSHPPDLHFYALFAVLPDLVEELISGFLAGPVAKRNQTLSAPRGLRAVPADAVDIQLQNEMRPRP